MTSAKRQLSVTVSREVLSAVERGVRAGRFPSRSAAVEAALRAWARQQRAAEIHAYYDAVTASDETEELELAKLARRAVASRVQPSRRRKARS